MSYDSLKKSKVKNFLHAIGAVVSLFAIAGAVSGLIAGHLSDRAGLQAGVLRSAPADHAGLYVMLNAPGNWPTCSRSRRF
jgi:MFS family permease